MPFAARTGKKPPQIVLRDIGDVAPGADRSIERPCPQRTRAFEMIHETRIQGGGQHGNAQGLAMLPVLGSGYSVGRTPKETEPA